MTWTSGAHNSNVSASASSSIASGTFSTGATTTTLVVGYVAFDDSNSVDDLTSVTDNVSGNTYNLGHSGRSTVTGTWIKGYWLYGPVNSPTIFTANFSANHTFKINCAAFFTNNVAGTITLDANPTVVTGNSATPTAPSVTPAVAGELYVAGCSQDAGGTLSAGGSATLLDQAGTLGGDEFQVNAGSGALQLTFSNTASSTWAGAVLTFQPPGSGTVFIPPRRLVKAYSLTANIKH